MRRADGRLIAAPIALLLTLYASAAWAHNVAEGDRAFVQATDGVAFLPFLYLGAKHMVTGYDHILFLIGVVFYLFKLRDVLTYVSLFAVGHSVTLILGVLLHTGANDHIIDAIIGLSVAYKGFENIGGLRKFGLNINSKLAVLVFGFCHGAGLATKLMDLSMSENGLLVNLIGFNIGVEIGQTLVLALVVSLLNLWRGRASFEKGALIANWGLIAAGVLLMFYQIAEYVDHV